MKEVTGVPAYAYEYAIPYAKILPEKPTKICIRNERLRYWFEWSDSPRLTLRRLLCMEPYMNPSLAFARYCHESIEALNGGEINYPEWMMTFQEWMLTEFISGGAMVAYVDKQGESEYLAFPTEVWAIYRVRVLARYGLKTLPLPCFEQPSDE